MFDAIFWDGPPDVQELHDWWSETASRKPLDVSLSLNLAVIERTSGRCIGGVSLGPVERHPAIIEIGYAFAVDSHGRATPPKRFGHCSMRPSASAEPSAYSAIPSSEITALAG
jgi:hypothetical protein